MFLFVNERLQGLLEERLRAWRQAGVSAPAMANLIEAETGVKVAGQTIRRWFEVLDADGDDEAVA